MKVYQKLLNDKASEIVHTEFTMLRRMGDLCVVNHSGGNITVCSKKMSGTWTVTGGNQNNVQHWTNVNKTSAVANTSRVDYLGVVSTVPIL